MSFNMQQNFCVRKVTLFAFILPQLWMQDIFCVLIFAYSHCHVYAAVPLWITVVTGLFFDSLSQQGSWNWKFIFSFCKFRSLPQRKAWMVWTLTGCWIGTNCLIITQNWIVIYEAKYIIRVVMLNGNRLTGYCFSKQEPVRKVRKQ